MAKKVAPKRRHRSKVSSFSPPKGRFVVSGATTDEELVRYGIPRRPGPNAPAKRREAWKKAFERELEFIVPELRTVPNKRHRLGRTRRKLENGDDQVNWSGSILTAGADLFQEIVGTWKVPNVDPPNGDCDGNTYYCSVWVGIGGTTAKNIIQAGIEHQVVCNDNQNNPTLYIWAQWFPKDEQKVSPFPIKAGDEIQIDVKLNSQTQFTATFTNLSQGHFSAFQVETEAAPGGYSGTSAEWIVERPTLGSDLGALADYGSAVCSDMTATTASGQTEDGSTGNLITMIDANNPAHTMSTPGVAAGILTVTYTA